jgi:hypothetical protein
VTERRDADGHLTHLKTPIGGDLTDEELRAIEHHWSLEPGILVKGTRTGKNAVSVTQRPEAIHEIKLSFTI